MAEVKTIAQARSEATHPSGNTAPDAPRLAELGELFKCEVTETGKYWRFTCLMKGCKKSWTLYRPMEFGNLGQSQRAADIDKGNFNALMAHGKAVHGDK